MKYVKIHHVTESVPQQIFALMIIMDMPFTQDLSLIPKLGPFVFLPRSDIRISRTSHLKARLATHSFGLRGQLLSPRALLLYELWLLNGSKGALRVMCSSTLRVSADPWALVRPLDFV